MTQPATAAATPPPATATPGPLDPGPMRVHRFAEQRIADLTAWAEHARSWANRRPVLAAIVFLATIFVTNSIVGPLIGEIIAVAAGARDVSTEVGNLVGKICAAVFLVIVLSVLKAWRFVGFGGPRGWTDLKLFILPGVIVAINVVLALLSLDTGGGTRLALNIPQIVLTGFWEDGLTRGLLLALLMVAALRRGRSPLATVVLAAVLFGALHLVNVVGGSLVGALAQVLYAALLGIGFGALVVRTNALWVLVALHTVFDVSVLNDPVSSQGASVAAHGASQFFGVILTLPLAIYGLVLLRKRKDAPVGATGPARAPAQAPPPAMPTAPQAMAPQQVPPPGPQAGPPPGPQAGPPPGPPPGSPPAPQAGPPPGPPPGPMPPAPPPR